MLLGLLLAWHATGSAAESTPTSVAPALELIVGAPQELSVPGIERWLVGDPGLVEVARAGADRLRLTPKAPGRTFVHIWSAGGRTTRALKILHMAPLPPSLTRPPRRDAPAQRYSQGRLCRGV